MSNDGGLSLLIVVYALDKRDESKLLWESMISISNTIKNTPWVVLVNLNEVIFLKKGYPWGVQPWWPL